MKRARSDCRALPVKILQALGQLQDGLNKFIDADWRAKRTADDWGLAVTMESCELIDSYPWKWWKNVAAQPDQNNIRVELVDILHFSLSGTMQTLNEQINEIPSDVETSISPPLIDTKNAVKTFRSVIFLAKLHRFDVITNIVVAAAEDLDFNLTAYYVAKHTLNYIRQLGGYKAGSYTKVVAGQEDNELLHACIENVSIGECTSEERFEGQWNDLMSRVYDAFNVAAADRRRVQDWTS